MNTPNNATTDFSAELAAATIGCRLRFTWLGAKRSLDEFQQSQAAAVFSADSEFLTASKKLFDTSRPEFKAVGKLKSKIRQYWQDNTLPFTEPGVRLLKRSAAAEFGAKIDEFTVELRQTVAELDGVYSELKSEAESRLGSLFNPSDYPVDLRDCFAVAADFPNLSPPDYLAELEPELYQRESRRVAAAFDEAVHLAEQAFADELAEMVERITATLDGSADGKPKVWRNSMIDNVKEFIGRFRSLSIGSSAELERLVDQAENTLSGITPAAIRNSSQVRDQVKTAFASVQTELAAAMVNRPSRRIVVGSEATPPSEPVADQSDEQQAEPVSTPDAAEPIAESVAEPIAATEPQAEPEAVAVELAAVEPEAEPVDDQAEPEAVEPAADPVNSVAFNLNYGGGNIRRLVWPDSGSDERRRTEPAALSASLHFTWEILTWTTERQSYCRVAYWLRFIPTDSSRCWRLGAVQIERSTDIEFDNGRQRWVAIDRATGKTIAIGTDRARLIESEISYLQNNFGE